MYYDLKRKMTRVGRWVMYVEVKKFRGILAFGGYHNARRLCPERHQHPSADHLRPWSRPRDYPIPQRRTVLLNWSCSWLAEARPWSLQSGATQHSSCCRPKCLGGLASCRRLRRLRIRHDWSSPSIPPNPSSAPSALPLVWRGVQVAEAWSPPPREKIQED